MAKNTSVNLGEHFEGFIASQIQSGRYSSVSEVVRSALRLLETHETKLAMLNQVLLTGEPSGVADFEMDDLISDLIGESNR